MWGRGEAGRLSFSVINYIFTYPTLYYFFQNTEQYRKEEIAVENDANPEELLNSGIINSTFFIREVLDIGYQTQIEYTWKLKCGEKQY